ncbi:glycosyl transferase family 2 [Pleurocapsa sp. CCALA 161]|uniref:HEAT repeat domain-containing protein n=1 Tax=Pleurocapsa sp. CCALA 161 TaxID=2107688 RepID=UPI000D080608|nr:HEAT repeat domain-containing protein [Pleurocapsa sp. CCALA 161]PSB08569.1 glycosyl transferase family 2 [Pleurocapsa sp. CCALA 161]
MTNTPNSAQNGQILSHEETDELLARINQQLTNGTFNHQDQQLIAQMVECLGDTRGLVRLGFAEALGVVGKPAVDILIEALLHHSNEVVRRAAGKTLTLIEDPVAVPHLIQALLHDQDTVVQASAIGALARIGIPSVKPLLEVLASPNSSESNKGHAAWGLAFIGAQAKDQLYEAYNSDSPEVRSAVVGAIAKVAEEDHHDTQSLDLLVNALKDNVTDVRSEAAAVLGNLKYQPAIPVLLELLHHPEPQTRKSAALSLMKIGDRHSLAALQTALKQESDSNTQKAIALAVSLLQKQTDFSLEDDWAE